MKRRLPQPGSGPQDLEGGPKPELPAPHGRTGEGVASVLKHLQQQSSTKGSSPAPIASGPGNSEPGAA